MVIATVNTKRLNYVLARLSDLNTFFDLARTRQQNVNFKLTEELNDLRKQVMEGYYESLSDLVANTTVPVESSEGDPPYPASWEECLQLSGQLSALIRDFGPNKTKVGAIPTFENAPKIFIVHGHDATNLLRLQNLLRDRFSLEVVILSESASEGRTIIEKFEAAAASVPYCIALLTPDDEVNDGTSSSKQARPNVIFELGWFYGRLGRSRVCILKKKGTNIHSDLDGIMRIEFNENVEECLLQLERELIQAGLKI